MIPIIFAIFAAALVGTAAIPPLKYHIQAQEDCEDFAERIVNGNPHIECREYPYEDGNGLTLGGTPVQERFTAEADEYQTPYDLFRVSTLFYIDKTGATNSKGEIGIFCDIHNNYIPYNGGWDKFITDYEIVAGYDFSSSTNMINSLCLSFPPASGDLPVLQEQTGGVL